jgi:hypothetical protein
MAAVGDLRVELSGEPLTIRDGFRVLWTVLNSFAISAPNLFAHFPALANTLVVRSLEQAWFPGLQLARTAEVLMWENNSGSPMCG